MTIVHERSIAAPPEVVWACFTDPREIVRWLAASATVEPVPGGAITWTHEDGRTVAGQIVELVPSRRIVFTYGWTDGWLGVAAGSSTVTVELRPEADGTRLRLRHDGLEGDAADRHHDGWAMFLDRLAAVAPTIDEEDRS